MKIAISGVQCTGKSTLLNALEKTKELRGYKFIREVVRSMKNITINEYGDDASQLAIADVHVRNLRYKNMVTDRCIMDCYAYGMYCYKHGTVSSQVIDKVGTIYERTIGRYDLICYIEPEFEMVPDKVRSTDPKFRDEVLGNFAGLVKELENEGANIVTLTGTVENRVKMFLDAYHGVLEYSKIVYKNR